MKLIREFSHFDAAKVLSVVVVILSFMSTPFITPDLIGPIYRPITLLLMGVLMWQLIRMRNIPIDNWDRLILSLVAISLLQGILVFLFYFEREGGTGLRSYLGFSLKYLLLLPVGWLLKRNYRFFLKVFWFPNLIIILLAIVLFFLLLGGIMLPYIEFSPDGRPHYFFYIGATNSVFNFGSSFFIRTAGFTDEPGRLALILTFLLVLNEFTFKKAFNRLILTICGFFTFSMAFIITIVPIAIYWYKIRLFKLVSLLKMLPVVLAPIVTYNVYVDDAVKADVHLAMEGLIYKRFESDGDGGFEGDSRSDHISFHLAALKKYPILGMYGAGESEFAKYQISSPTFLGNMARNGIIFDLLYYLPFFVLFYKFGSKSRYWLFISIGLNFLQRPGLEHMFFLIVCSLLYYSPNFAKENA